MFALIISQFGTMACAYFIFLELESCINHLVGEWCSLRVWLPRMSPMSELVRHLVDILRSCERSPFNFIFYPKPFFYFDQWWQIYWGKRKYKGNENKNIHGYKRLTLPRDKITKKSKQKIVIYYQWGSSFSKKELKLNEKKKAKKKRKKKKRDAQSQIECTLIVTRPLDECIMKWIAVVVLAFLISSLNKY